MNTNFHKDRDLIILHADKGNTTVVTDTSDYNRKITDLLSQKNTYNKVTKILIHQDVKENIPAIYCFLREAGNL